jgi:hypothetical protein
VYTVLLVPFFLGGSGKRLNCDLSFKREIVKTYMLLKRIVVSREEKIVFG